MKFYEIDNALIEAIEAGDKPVRVQIDFSGGAEKTASMPFFQPGVFAEQKLHLKHTNTTIHGGENFESVFEQDILEADFYGLKEAAGGTSARGELLLDNPQGIYSYTGAGPGTQVKVSFSLGDGLPYFERFIFYIDDNGIQ
ncbi:MAG: hypothetical protein LBB98_02985, partial [Treponema sp.]|nr:hypothetical protein [Treponema sp.]